MAVTGLPEPDEMHAVSMARFAYQVITKMDQICNELEATLGPGTEELAMRVGLHSGPVTAGVLRGQKSRFQLFGDTVNTASRMESKGEKGRIQVSEETAKLLIKAGKSHWIKERVDKIEAKGKGVLQTYWLDPRKNMNAGSFHKRTVSGYSTDESGVLAGRSTTSGEMPEQAPSLRKFRKKKKADARRPSLNGDDSASAIFRLGAEREKRLIDWNTDVLLKYLENVIKCREPLGRSRSVCEIDHDNEDSELPHIFDSVSEVITFPKFDPFLLKRRHDEKLDSAMLDLRPKIHKFVTELAALYNDVPFHNFEVCLTFFWVGNVRLALYNLISFIFVIYSTPRMLLWR
jgi:hypothetical protein